MRLSYKGVTGNLVIDNQQLYFEQGICDEWVYPDNTSLSELLYWYKLIAIMSGCDVCIDVSNNNKEFKLV